jgi:hypothetical protein
MEPSMLPLSTYLRQPLLDASQRQAIGTVHLVCTARRTTLRYFRRIRLMA